VQKAFTEIFLKCFAEKHCFFTAIIWSITIKHLKCK